MMKELNLLSKYFVEKLNKLDNLEKINREIAITSGIVNFFNSEEEFKKIKNEVLYSKQIIIENSEKDFGDYQTPIEFAYQVCDILKEVEGINPEIIIEPTFGKGHFLMSALEVFENINNVYGVEIQKKYNWITKLELLNLSLKKKEQLSPQINLFTDNIFTHVFNKETLNADGHEILVLGNPPWLTNSELSSIGSKNLPQKSNFKSFKGLDAITGKGNFDIAEYIILQMLDTFSNYTGTIAMLCKNIVSKNIIYDLRNYDFNISDIKIYNFDAKKVFNVSCDASLFVAKLGTKTNEKTCQVYNLDEPTKLVKTFGWSQNDKFVSNVNNYERYINLDGKCIFEWRQGVKHDCSKVMELNIDNKSNKLFNKLKENVNIEETYVYNLLKSSDLKHFEIKSSRKKVIITQKKVKEDTSPIKEIAPLTWEYLVEHKEYFDKRKSSIYRNSPQFSIFGIGDYSFKKYKVAISGMYKKGQFCLVYPINNKPTMLDDTCYFIGFNNYKHALFTCALLNSQQAQDFLKSITFLDSKRPYTKDILSRIDLIQLSNIVNYQEILGILDRNNVEVTEQVTENDYENYRLYINSLNQGNNSN